jgi:uncharacterized protein with HEPN domain
MPREKEDLVYLWDMLDAAGAVAEFVKGKSYRDYESDRMLRGAVERHVEIIGEAAKRVSEGFREAHGEIPWRGIIGVRNVLAHDYGEVKDDKMWVVATSSVPELIAALEPLVPSDADGER